MEIPRGRVETRMERRRQESALRLPPIIASLLVVAALYFAREILVPLAVAVLLSFLLTPSVRRLERWKLGRVPSVLLASPSHAAPA
jgi:predicted PurR-regulated permease PerM